MRCACFLLLMVGLAFAGAKRMPAQGTSSEFYKTTSLPDDAEPIVAGYHLTKDALERYSAALKKLREAIADDPAIGVELADHTFPDPHKSFDEIVTWSEERTPHATAVMKTAGFGWRELYLVIVSIRSSARAFCPADSVACAEQNAELIKTIRADYNELQRRAAECKKQ